MMIEPCHAGFCVGNTPLIKLSPKKTWEGFLGGLIMTILASWWLGEYMSRFKWMVCPRTVSPCSIGQKMEITPPLGVFRSWESSFSSDPHTPHGTQPPRLGPRIVWTKVEHL